MQIDSAATPSSKDLKQNGLGGRDELFCSGLSGPVDGPPRVATGSVIQKHGLHLMARLVNAAFAIVITTKSGVAAGGQFGWKCHAGAADDTRSGFCE